jgi:hypothetical protein
MPPLRPDITQPAKMALKPSVVQSQDGDDNAVMPVVVHCLSAKNVTPRCRALRTRVKGVKRSANKVICRLLMAADVCVQTHQVMLTYPVACGQEKPIMAAKTKRMPIINKKPAVGQALKLLQRIPMCMRVWSLDRCPTAIRTRLMTQLQKTKGHFPKYIQWGIVGVAGPINQGMIAELTVHTSGMLLGYCHPQPATGPLSCVALLTDNKGKTEFMWMPIKAGELC